MGKNKIKPLSANPTKWSKELFNNYVTLKLTFFTHPLSRFNTNDHKTPLRYVTGDTDTPLYHLFFLLEVGKKNDKHSPMTHPPMLLNN